MFAVNSSWMVYVPFLTIVAEEETLFSLDSCKKENKSKSEIPSLLEFLQKLWLFTHVARDRLSMDCGLLESDPKLLP